MNHIFNMKLKWGNTFKLKNGTPNKNVKEKIEFIVSFFEGLCNFQFI